jgi:hypothetical protein
MHYDPRYSHGCSQEFEEPTAMQAHLKPARNHWRAEPAKSTRPIPA